MAQRRDVVAVPLRQRAGEQLVGGHLRVAQQRGGHRLAVQREAERLPGADVVERRCAGVDLELDGARQRDADDLRPAGLLRALQRHRVHAEHDVRLAALRQQRTALGPPHRLAAHPLDGRRALVPAVEGDDVDGRRLLHPPDPVRPRADDLGHRAVRAVAARRQDLRARVRQHGGQRGEGVGQLDPDRVTVRGDAAHRRVGQRALVVERGLQRGRDRLSGYRAAVVELRARTEVEGPGQTVGRGGPRRRQPGLEHALAVGLDERRGNLHPGEEAPGGSRVKAVHLEGADHPQRPVGRRAGRRSALLLAAARRQQQPRCDPCRRRPSPPAHVPLLRPSGPVVVDGARDGNDSHIQ